LELTGGQFQPGQANHVFVRMKGSQVIGRARIEQVVLGDRSGRHHAGDLAANQPFGQGRVLDLVADGHSLAGLDQLVQIVFQLVMWKTRHGNGFVTAGKGQAQEPGRQLRIRIEQLIKIPHAKQQQHARMARAGFLILLHHGGGHESVLCI